MKFQNEIRDAKQLAVKLLNAIESIESLLGDDKLQLIYPLDIEKHKINYPFGHRRDTYDHEGIDFFAPAGTPVLAMYDGVIDKIYTGRFYGKCIKIIHEVGNQKYITYSAHLRQWLVAMEPRAVKQGDVIGLSGNTGNSTAPHFHVTLVEVGSTTRLRGISLAGCVDPAQFGVDWPESS